MRTSNMSSRTQHALPFWLALFLTLLILWQPVLLDRKSTRLNSSHVAISYAVFCLKKKKVERRDDQPRHPKRRDNAPVLLRAPLTRSYHQVAPADIVA